VNEGEVVPFQHGSAMSGQVRKEGWLKKSAPILGGKKVLWKAKWCVLEVNDARRVVNLLYFDKQRDAVPKA
jgi:hypothetical protein